LKQRKSLLETKSVLPESKKLLKRRDSERFFATWYERKGKSDQLFLSGGQSTIFLYGEKRGGLEGHSGHFLGAHTRALSSLGLLPKT